MVNWKILDLDKELRYQIIGKVFGRLIMVIAEPLAHNKIISAFPTLNFV